MASMVFVVVLREGAVFAVIILLVVAVEFVATEVDMVLVAATNGWGADLTARSSRSCRRRADKKQK